MQPFKPPTKEIIYSIVHQLNFLFNKKTALTRGSFFVKSKYIMSFRLLILVSEVITRGEILGLPLGTIP